MKLISNHKIQKFHSGIVKVIVNTVSKWCDYTLTLDHTFIVSEEGGNNLEYLKLELPFEKDSKYHFSFRQEKDQIVIMFIPYCLIN